MFNNQNTLLTYKDNGAIVTVTPASKRILQEHEKIMADKLKTSNIKAEYSLIQDLSQPSLKPAIQASNGKRFFIQPSKPVDFVKDAKIFESCAKHYDLDKHNLRTLIYTKELFTSNGSPLTILIRDRRDQAVMPVKINEPWDLIKQVKVARINVPQFIIQIEMPLQGEPDKKRLISVNKKLENVISVDKLLTSDISEKEKEEIFLTVKTTFNKLIEADLMPAFARAGHVLLTKEKPRQYYYVDMGTKFTLLTRNRLFLLEELASPHSKIHEKVDWDKITKTTETFAEYYQSLPKEARKSIQKRKLDNLLSDIQRKPNERGGLSQMRKKQNRLIIELFPNSKAAEKIRKTGTYP